MEVEIKETGPCWRKRRYVVVFMAFFGYLSAYTLRTNMNVAIISMIQKNNVTLSNGTIIEDQQYHWDKKQQGYVLSSFFWGYIVTQFPGGFLAIKFGGVLILGLSVLLSAVITLLCPVCAYGNIWLLVSSRILIGLFSGPMFPSANAIWARWAPPKEKAWIVAFVFSGTIIGTIVGNAISGIVCATLGWESAFYLFGALGIVWATAWLVFIKERPELDKCCSEAESNYIKSVLNVPFKVVHPYKAMFKSLPFWAICVAQTCSNWGFYTMLTQYPIFLKNALHYDVKKSGAVSAAPYLFMGLLLNLGGIVSDIMINKKCLSTTMVRKLLFTISLIVQAIFLLAAVFVTNGPLSVAFMTISISMTGLAWASQL
ncbi:hypothetical protein ACFFRR_000869 [Megaselia abdita]